MCPPADDAVAAQPGLTQRVTSGAIGDGAETSLKSASATGEGAPTARAGAANHLTYMTLNGLRGVAAICVMVFHRSEWFGPRFLMPGAYLAVDFFFILSGFVIGHAYADRMGGELGFGPYFQRRLIRLLPMTVVGALLGAVVFFIDHRGRNLGHLLLDTVATMLTLPTPWNSGNWRLDPSLWSLFYELIVNVIFGLVIATLGGRRLWPFVCVLGVLFLLIYPQEYLHDAGFSREFGGCLVRATLLFFFGVLLDSLHRKSVFRWMRIGLVVGSTVVVASFMFDPDTANGSIARLGVVLVLYPLVILGAANHEPKGRLRRAASFGGDISYPLYVLHFPLLAMIAGASVMLHHSKQPDSYLEAAARFALVVIASWVALKCYDEPVRRFLSMASSRRFAGS